jgi:hypothetical protein
MSDIANEITNSLDRGGRGGMTGPFGVVDGTLAAPGLRFTTDSDNGLRRTGVNTWTLVAAGVDIMQVDINGLTLLSGSVTNFGASVDQNDTVPPNFIKGDLWFESDTGNFYVQYQNPDTTLSVVGLNSVANKATSGPISVVVSTATGSHVVPAGATRAKAYIKAAGGAGGGSSINPARGGGGGEGEERWGWFNVVAGSTTNVGVGLGGVSILANTNSNGSTGGTSTWANGVILMSANGGSGGAAGNVGGAGGPGGTGGTGGDYGMPGATGQAGADATSAGIGINATGGGKGGGGAGTVGISNSGGGGGVGAIASASGAGATGIVVTEYWA